MSFMEMQITDKMRGYEIETTHGTVFLPGDVTTWSPIEQSAKECFGDYVESGPDGIEDVKEIYGYFGRYSAPGYMDCTDWTFDTNRKRLVRELRDAYGDE